VGMLTQRGSDTGHSLTRHQVIGRSSTANLRIDETRVSGRHAALRWDGTRWQLKDLNSRNGTFVRGGRLVPGATVTLSLGDEVAFGCLENTFVLADASAPVQGALLLAKNGEAALQIEDGLCVLPSWDTPELTIYRDAQGNWWRESRDAPEAVLLTEGEQLVVGGERFRFTSNVLTEQTSATEIGETLLFLAELALEFAVSQDEEYVELSAKAGEHTLVMGSKSAYYLLYTLARVRLHHPLPRVVSTSEGGWLSVDTLETLLGTSREHINVDVCRIRQVFREKGVSDPAAIIERRNHLLRIGTAQISIRTL
jgi:pSer/pThr/pTyr-binding forkhead associated (FHA) protein